MCCSLDRKDGKITVHSVAYEEGEVIYLKGIYDRAPDSSLAARFSRFLQNLECLEKKCEIADESFHLLGSFFQHYANILVYQNLCQLHHAAHHVEHVLHSFCFLGDVTRLLTGKFLKDVQGRNLNFLCSVSRLCHAVAHLFATAEFLNELKLFPIERFEKAFKYAALLSTTGYALWTISLIWERWQGSKNKEFKSDLAIHLGGFFFEAIHFGRNFEAFSYYPPIFNKIASLAGIIHAGVLVHRLTPKDQEKFITHFTLPSKVKGPIPDSHKHDGHLHHRWIEVKAPD